MKKLLAILLLLALCLTVFPAAALASDEAVAEDTAADAVPAEEEPVPEQEPAEEPAPADEATELPEEEPAPVEEEEPVLPEETSADEEAIVSEEPPVEEGALEAPAEDGVTPDAFRVGSAYYTALSDALAAVKSGDVIVVDKSTTVTAGNYTIPAGVTLIIPYDGASSITKYRTLPKEGTGEPYEFVRLTLPTGTTLTIADGADLCVGAGYSLETSHYASVAGAYGRIALSAGSSIVLQSGSRLFAYGFITGDGTVVASSGSKVWEYMEIGDFRGRSATVSLLDNSRHIFPFTQYYVQNIEAELRLYSGAEETVIVPDSDTGVNLQLPFIGSDGLFQLTSGYLDRKYNASTDRVSYVIRDSGRFSINSINIFGYDSSAYVFPVCGNLSFTLTNGSVFTVNNDIMMIPGSSLTIEEGARMTVSLRKTVYVIDSSEWNGKGYLYSEPSWGSVNGNWRTAYYVPDRVTRLDAGDPGDARVVVNGTLSLRGSLVASKSGATILTGPSASIPSDIALPSVSLYMIKADGTEDPIPLAKVFAADSKTGDVNGDGSVNKVDAALLLRYLVQLIDESTIDKVAADTNGDGAITIADVAAIPKK